MVVKKPRFRTRPEFSLQRRIIMMLRDRGWFVRSTHGNAFQKGFPDLFCYNPAFERAPLGPCRWIDVKVKGQHRYTKAQCLEWPEWEIGGVGIWILMGYTDEDYGLLFRPPNFREFWRPSYDKYRIPVSEIIKELE